MKIRRTMTVGSDGNIYLSRDNDEGNLVVVLPGVWPAQDEQVRKIVLRSCMDKRRLLIEKAQAISAEIDFLDECLTELSTEGHQKPTSKVIPKASRGQ